MNRKRSWAVALVASAMMLSACSSSNDAAKTGSDFDQIGDCTPIYAAVSSEKMGLVHKLSQLFQDSAEGKSLSHCAGIIPQNVPSGEAARLLKAGWPTTDTDKPQPAIWSPASTSWVDQVKQRLNVDSIGDAASIARSPLVIAMPEQMARQLGWPDKSISLQDLHNLCLDPAGWGKFGPAQSLWGSFKIGKTNPDTSTSGQNILLMQDYAASNKKGGLTVADVDASSQFSKELESCVIHYGNTTGNVLQRAYDLDQKGKPLGYISAVAVEETSVINYNLGNPDSHAVKDGEKLTPPKRRIVAVYPSGGSLQSDNPLVALDNQIAPWVKDDQRQAAQAFLKFAQTDTAQKVLGVFGFRPADAKIAPSGLVTAQYGVDPAQPAALLPQPPLDVIAAAKQQWQQFRKPSSVLELLDISGSMSENVNGTNLTRMDAAKQSASATLDHFRATDQVGMELFTTNDDASKSVNIALRKLSPLGGDKENLQKQIDSIEPQSGTPLYDAIAASYDEMQKVAQPGRINAIVVLSDGEDTDSVKYDLDTLLAKLRGNGNQETTNPNPVRIFPIVYGSDAANSEARDALTKIAEASGGQVFDASDARRINLVFSEVINNF